MPCINRRTNLLICISVNFIHPLLDVVETLLVGYVIHDNNAVRSSVVRRSNRSKSLLTSGIPNLQFDGFPIKLQGPDLEINTNRADVAFGVRVIGETEEKA